MNLFNKKPNGVWKDKNGQLRYPDGVPFNKEFINTDSEFDQMEDSLKSINTRQQAMNRIKELSDQINNAKKYDDLKMTFVREIKILMEKYNLTETELNRELGANNWVNFKEGKGFQFPNGGLH